MHGPREGRETRRGPKTGEAKNKCSFEKKRNRLGGEKSRRNVERGDAEATDSIIEGHHYRVKLPPPLLDGVIDEW